MRTVRGAIGWWIPGASLGTADGRCTDRQKRMVQDLALRTRPGDYRYADEMLRAACWAETFPPYDESLHPDAPETQQEVGVVAEPFYVPTTPPLAEEPAVTVERPPPIAQEAPGTAVAEKETSAWPLAIGVVLLVLLAGGTR